MDLRASGGPGGIFSVEAVKYTTARAVAERMIDRIVEELGARAAPCRTAITPVDDGWTDTRADHEIEEVMRQVESAA